MFSTIFSGKPKSYSFYTLARNAFSHHMNWQKAWRSPEPKKKYDVIIIGAGGHGLATAYYLAENHGITNVAVLEKSWLGGGNTGRNTTIIRSNYLQDESIKLYDLSHRLYHTLSQKLNYNIMFSPRGLLMLCQSEHELRSMKRIAHNNQIHSLESQMITPSEVKKKLPLINIDKTARYPILGALYQKTGGTARHDAVAWGFARAADARGVDIIQKCQVIKIIREKDKVVGVQTNKTTIKADKIAIVTAGNTTTLTDTVGINIPIESVALQALVSEPVKPILDKVVMANTVHGYISQSDKGEMIIGGGTDSYNNYSQRGSFSNIENTVAAMVEIFPFLSRLRMLRQWGGIVDMTGDRSPIISKTDIKGLFLNCGWGTGGFKAIPGSGLIFADTIANDRPHKIAAPFALDRFKHGKYIDESLAAAVAH